MSQSLPLLSLAHQIGEIGPVGAELISELIARLLDHGEIPDCSEMLVRICERTAAVGVSCDDQIVAVNAYFANLLGYTRQELAGLPVAAIIAGPRDLLTSPWPFVKLMPFRRKTGAIFPMRVTALPVLAGPQRICWIGVFDAL